MVESGFLSYSEPDFLPWDGRIVPITFIGGYLGAGKTTAINELLARTTRPIAVIVNDVGSVNVDAALIKSRNGDTIELTDGCVCCTMVDGFGAVFNDIRARDVPPDQVVVELSGIAEPDKVRPWGRSAGFSLDGVIVLVDTDQFESHPSNVASYVRAQIGQADLLVMTKRDLCQPSTVAAVTEKLHEIAPETPVVSFDQAMAMGGLLSTGARSGSNAVSQPETTLFDAHQVTGVPMGQLADQAAVYQVLNNLDSNVVRAKGIAELADGSKVLIHQVGRRRSVTPLPASEPQAQTDLIVITID